MGPHFTLSAVARVLLLCSSWFHSSDITYHPHVKILLGSDGPEETLETFSPPLVLVSLLCCIFVAVIFHFYHFGHTAQLVGSYFPNQGLNLHPLAAEARSLNRWTAGEAL